MDKHGSCQACGKYRPLDRAHIKARGSHPHLADYEWNIMSICRECHSFQHQVGFKKFFETYPGLWGCLKVAGWEFNIYNKLNYKHFNKDVSDDS